MSSSYLSLIIQGTIAMFPHHMIVEFINRNCVELASVTIKFYRVDISVKTIFCVCLFFFSICLLFFTTNFHIWSLCFLFNIIFLKPCAFFIVLIVFIVLFESFLTKSANYHDFGPFLWNKFCVIVFKDYWLSSSHYFFVFLIHMII